eukprot:Skav223877  [mRNA]  locus=scaffold1226:423504:425489:- [translate_table: standard]
MLCGRVCQLSYEGGGRVLSKNSRGESLIFRFEKGLCGPPLQIGQSVCFSLKRGYDEAVDVQIVEPSEGNAIESGSDWHSPMPSPESQQMLQLQRRIGRFRNASAIGQAELVTRAEEKLHELLEEDPLDGDEIAKLVRRCSGWLCAPVVHANQVEPSNQQHSDSIGDEQTCLQQRLRKLLIRAFKNLDLGDSNTREAVKPALTYIQALLEQNTSVGHSRSRAARQWNKLKSAVFLEHDTSISSAAPKRESLNRTERNGGKALTKGACRVTKRSPVVGGNYRPHEKGIKASKVDDIWSLLDAEKKGYVEREARMAWRLCIDMDWP